uniref:C-type lectin domain-containing protein n=1 Tax=Timema tahoe TaxID=61484 RepID=A0A7R9FF79_9NEOP|nr:unnamed protein product [Timema tahoe]
MLGLVAQTRASFQLVRDVGYYKYHTNKVTWQEAQDTCRREDSNLVLVNTPQEMAAIGEIMHQHGVRYIYSGFHDLFLHGQYVTVFGDLLSKCCLEEWEEGALSPSPSYNCGSVSKEHKLAVQDCSKKLPFICENPLWFDYEYFPGVGYYKLFTSGENWVGAHKRCTLDGAHLAVINSETEAEVFRQLLARFPTLNNTDHDHRALVGFHAIYDTTSPDDCKKFYTVHDIPTGYPYQERHSMEQSLLWDLEERVQTSVWLLRSLVQPQQWWPRDYLETLKKNGVNTNYVRISKTSATGMAQITVADSGENQIVIAAGANHELSPSDVNAAADAIHAADVLIFQFETPIETTLHTLKLKRKGMIVRDNVQTVECAGQAVVKLLDMGCNKVILTLGHQGAVFATQEDRTPIHVYSPKMKAVDTTGAGDMFIGALGYYLAYHPLLPLKEVVRRSCEVASISVLRLGTQSSFPSREELPASLFQ